MKSLVDLNPGTVAFRPQLGPRWLRVIALSLLLGGGAVSAGLAQSPVTNPVINPLSLQWPRYFAASGYEFAVYQP